LILRAATTIDVFNMETAAGGRKAHQNLAGESGDFRNRQLKRLPVDPLLRRPFHQSVATCHTIKLMTGCLLLSVIVAHLDLIMRSL
jgi:hypothetical protein